MVEGGLGYLAAGYLLTWAVLAAYVVRLERRLRGTEEELAGPESGTREVPGGVGG